MNKPILFKPGKTTDIGALIPKGFELFGDQMIPACMIVKLYSGELYCLLSSFDWDFEKEAHGFSLKLAYPSTRFYNHIASLYLDKRKSEFRIVLPGDKGEFIFYAKIVDIAADFDKFKQKLVDDYAYVTFSLVDPD